MLGDITDPKRRHRKLNLYATWNAVHGVFAFLSSGESLRNLRVTKLQLARFVLVHEGIWNDRSHKV